MRATLFTWCVAGILGGGIASADTFYGTYQLTATHTCNDPQCAQATDTITGTGSNSVQGASTIAATNLTETGSATLQVTGPFTLTSGADGSELFGIIGISFSGTGNPVDVLGAAQILGGTGPYTAFSASSTAVGTALFTSQTTAEGTLTFTPEPQSWAELLLALPALTLLRHFRLRQS